MKIVKISILKRKDSTDMIFVLTDLPSTFPFYKDDLVLKFEVVSGGGEEYVEKHFPGIPIKIIIEGD